MSTQLARAIQLFSEAKLAEEQDNLDRAEVLYGESRDLFMQEGDAYWIDAAAIMNTIACMKEQQGDYEGALRAAKKSIQILDWYAGEPSDQRSEEVRLHAWGIVGNLHFHLAHYDDAKDALQRALDYAAKIPGEADQQTAYLRERLAILHRRMMGLKKNESLWRKSVRRE